MFLSGQAMDLKSRALELGIETDFIDALGHVHSAGLVVLEGLLDTFAQSAPHRFISQPVILRVGQPSSTDLGSNAILPVDWAIHIGEQEGTPTFVQGQSADGLIHWPANIDPGVYRLSLVDAHGCKDENVLVVSPPRAFAGKFDRTWVLTLQLYSLKSSSNWGIGDFSDLQSMIRLAVAAGAAGVGLNPLHALFDDHPEDCSPYSPNSRLFLNPLYTDVSRAPGLPPDFLSEHADRMAALRAVDMVDYAAVAELKRQAFRLAFEHFKTDGSREDVEEFQVFQFERGDMLLRFACFEALRHRHRGPWWDWPVEFRQPDMERLEALRHGADADEILYVAFVQWLAHRQLCQCRDLATTLGMRIGLYLDVAVGVKTDGFDAWDEQLAISRYASVGAPPDPLNTAGQDWGLAGFNAPGLERRLFQPFCDMIEASMRYAGAIRLDHVLGLQRIYLVPAGFSARDGVYVRMPFEALVALIVSESHKYKCVVIGEDLGTVPEGFRERLGACGIWSYRVMIFERHSDGSFKRPDDYDPHALVTFSTHDLPTFAGWKTGHDLATKLALGMDPGETEEQRRTALSHIRDIVSRRNSDEIGFNGILRFLDQTRSRILAIALDDLQCVTDQPNIPGTIDQHPNWRRKLPVGIEAFAAELDIVELRQILGSRVSSSPPVQAGV